jgi:SOS-response transcriptional repressor LexA
MTALQRRLYDYIDSYWKEFGFAPSYAQMAFGLGVKSKSNIYRLIHAMAAAGHVEIVQSRCRSVRCVPVGTNEYQLGYQAGYAAALAERQAA